MFFNNLATWCASHSIYSCPHMYIQLHSTCHTCMVQSSLSVTSLSWSGEHQAHASRSLPPERTHLQSCSAENCPVCLCLCLCLGPWNCLCLWHSCFCCRWDHCGYQQTCRVRAELQSHLHTPQPLHHTYHTWVQRLAGWSNRGRTKDWWRSVNTNVEYPVLINPNVHEALCWKKL